MMDITVTFLGQVSVIALPGDCSVRLLADVASAHFKLNPADVNLFSSSEEDLLEVCPTATLQATITVGEVLSLSTVAPPSSEKTAAAQLSQIYNERCSYTHQALKADNPEHLALALLVENKTEGMLEYAQKLQAVKCFASLLEAQSEVVLVEATLRAIKTAATRPGVALKLLQALADFEGFNPFENLSLGSLPCHSNDVLCLLASQGVTVETHILKAAVTKPENAEIVSALAKCTQTEEEEAEAMLRVSLPQYYRFFPASWFSMETFAKEGVFAPNGNMVAHFNSLKMLHLRAFAASSGHVGKEKPSKEIFSGAKQHWEGVVRQRSFWGMDVKPLIADVGRCKELFSLGYVPSAGDVVRACIHSQWSQLAMMRSAGVDLDAIEISGGATAAQFFTAHCGSCSRAGAATFGRHVAHSAADPAGRQVPLFTVL